MEPYEYVDEARDKLTVSQGDGGVFVDAGRVFVPTMELADLCVAMFLRSGQPAPVITPRPDVDTSEPVNFRGFRLVAVDLGRQVRVEAGETCEVLPPHAVRQFAGLLVAFADAAEVAAGPDPADVERMASLFTEASRMAPEDAARYLLRKGVTLPGGDGGNG